MYPEVVVCQGTECQTHTHVEVEVEEVGGIEAKGAASRSSPAYSIEDGCVWGGV